jgi:hypothetical protein
MFPLLMPPQGGFFDLINRIIIYNILYNIINTKTDLQEGSKWETISWMTLVFCYS